MDHQPFLGSFDADSAFLGDQCLGRYTGMFKRGRANGDGELLRRWPVPSGDPKTMSISFIGFCPKGPRYVNMV